MSGLNVVWLYNPETSIVFFFLLYAFTFGNIETILLNQPDLPNNSDFMADLHLLFCVFTLWCSQF